jgi:hypothetical protein
VGKLAVVRLKSSRGGQISCHHRAKGSTACPVPIFQKSLGVAQPGPRLQPRRG